MNSYTLSLVLCIMSFVVVSDAKVFGKCELAAHLEEDHGMAREDVKNWVCIAEFESTFNTAAINTRNWDGSKDYGLFQLNNRYWCDDDFGNNVCGISCQVLLDDDITDDLICTRTIIKDTERWTNTNNGLTAWVAYVNRCQNINLDEYMKECWSSNVTKTDIKSDTQSTANETKEAHSLITTDEAVTDSEMNAIPVRGSGFGQIVPPITPAFYQVLSAAPSHLPLIFVEPFMVNMISLRPTAWPLAVLPYQHKYKPIIYHFLPRPQPLPYYTPLTMQKYEY